MDSLKLDQLVATLREQQETKVDTVIASSKLSFVNKQLVYEDPRFGPLVVEPGRQMHTHLAQKAGIPMKYYDRLLSETEGDLLDRNLNHWLHKLDKPFMVRSFAQGGGSAKGRAVLSDKFNLALDNLNVLTAFLDAAFQAKREGINLQVSECNLNDTNLYVRLTAPDNKVQARDLLKDYRRPDGKTVHGDDNFGVFSGLIMRNSEVGRGSFTIRPMMIVSKCVNETIFREYELRKIHVGSKLEEGVNYQADTIAATMEATKLQTRDAVGEFMKPEFLQARVNEFSKWNRALDHPLDTARNLSAKLNFSEGVTNSLVDAFMKSGDTSAFGLQQAVTWVAKHSETLDMNQRYDIAKDSYQWMKDVDVLDRSVAVLA